MPNTPILIIWQGKVETYPLSPGLRAACPPAAHQKAGVHVSSLKEIGALTASWGCSGLWLEGAYSALESGELELQQIFWANVRLEFTVIETQRSWRWVDRMLLDAGLQLVGMHDLRENAADAVYIRT